MNTTGTSNFDDDNVRFHASIPRILHTVWFDLGGNPTPPVAKYAEMQASRAKHMDPQAWQHIEWSRPMADHFLREHYPWFLPCWETYKEPIYNIDAIRYFVLYHYGGVYLDQDVVLHRPIDEMLVNEDGSPRHVVICRDHDGKRLNNCVMASARGHPFFGYMIRRLTQTHKSIFHCRNSFVGTMYTAGPLFLQDSLGTYMNAYRAMSKSPSLEANDIGICVLPTCAWLPGDALKTKCQPIRDYAYGEHMYAKSWGFSQKLTMDFCRCAFLALVAIILVVVGICLQRRSCDMGGGAYPTDTFSSEGTVLDEYTEPYP